MKIFKILSVGLITFLGLPEGKAADFRVADAGFTAAQKLSSFIEMTSIYTEDLQKCEEIRQQTGAHNNVGILLSSYPELQPEQRGFNQNFNAGETYYIVRGIEDTERKIQQLNGQLKQLSKQLEEIYNLHALPTTSTLPVQQMSRQVGHAAEEIAPYIPGGTPTTAVILEEGRKNNPMRVLTSADIIKFKDECEALRQVSLAFADGSFDNASGGLKSSFCFYTMNSYLQDFIRILESGKQSDSPAGNAVAKIFYEKDTNKFDSQDFKKGLLDLIKVIDESQRSAFLELFAPTKQQEFLEIGKTIKEYIEAHKA